MNKDYRKQIEKEIKINNCLTSIEEPVKIASGYIKGELDVFDLDELTIALENIESYCNDIRNLVSELVYEYEKEIEELDYEQ